MQTKWITAAVALVFLASCFFPWVVVEGREIVISGVQAEGTRFGKPGYLSLLLIGIYFFFNFIPTNWAHRTAVFLAALNFGWTLRNFFLISACQAGECPVRQPAFYVYAITSCLLLLLVLFRKVIPMPDNAEAPATPNG